QKHECEQPKPVKESLECLLEEGFKRDSGDEYQCGVDPNRLTAIEKRCIQAAFNVAEPADESRDDIRNSKKMHAAYDRCVAEEKAKPSAREPVPPNQGPPPIGGVYGPYTKCANPPQCSMGVVSVAADGLNVRVAPDGPPVMSLVNGTPLIPFQKQGDWL